MSRLAEEISKLTNPIPLFEDPEDTGDATQAKLFSRSADDDDEIINAPSKLRSQAALLHPEQDAKYSGRRVSRKSLMDIDEECDDDDDLDDDDDDDDDEDEDNVEEFEDVDKEEDDEIGDESDEDVIDTDVDDDIVNFREKLQFQETTRKDFLYEDDGDYAGYGDDDNNDDVDKSENDDDGNDDDDESDDDQDLEKLDHALDKSANSGGLQKFTKTDVEEEIEKGKAVRTQLNIYDGLLETRIRLQKVLQIVNQLPQHDVYPDFLHETGPELKKSTHEVTGFLYKLLEQLVTLQTSLLLQNSETSRLLDDKQDDDDEEIPSDSDEEVQPSSTSLKRKLKPEEFPEFLSKRHKKFKKYRNDTIQKWYDKTRISSGRIGKDFSAFDQSAVKQIDQILANKDRLIRRTQVRRTQYKTLGKTHVADETSEAGTSVKPARDSLVNIDEEVFDDDDFYHELLRELIDRKTLNTDDPVALSRHWLEIQKLRKKPKKNVDTRASKERKIRYDVKEKLVNFMAPYDTHLWTEESKNELFNSVFGKGQDAVDNTVTR